MPEEIGATYNLRPGVYRHYKGGLYRVHGVGYEHDGLAPVVVYESLQDRGDFPAGTFFTRPYSAFTQSILTENGEEVERFAYEDDYDHWIL